VRSTLHFVGRRTGILDCEAKMIYTIFETRPGWMGVLCSGAGLRRITLPKPSRDEALLLLGACPGEEVDSSSFGDLPDRLRRFLSGEAVIFPDKLDLTGASLFRIAVLGAVRSIPYGETRSYAWVAERIGRPKAARAVGGALAKNPLPIVVPCHRVVGSDGSLCGFGGGLEMKRALLDMEARAWQA